MSQINFSMGYTRFKMLIACAVSMLLMTWASLLQAQSNASSPPPPVIGSQVASRSVSEWLMRMHEATRVNAYVGTFVVSSGGNLSSSRIWHVCNGEQQMERVESLSGTPRSTFRRNDQVIVFLPERRVAVIEKRETAGVFPNFLPLNDTALTQFYRVTVSRPERVAGFDADVVQLHPTDGYRFGYRAWIEKKTGLAVKMQTLDGQEQVLEQVAFSDLELNAPVNLTKLSQMMDRTEGYKVEKVELVKTSPAAEGWALKTVVPGFKSMSCFKRTLGAESGIRPESTFQWVFSDGLASVSIFIEAFELRQHGQPGSLAMGATHTLTRRVGRWWLTVVGEVPLRTLMAFAQGLERVK